MNFETLSTYISPETLTSWGVAGLKTAAILIIGFMVAGWARKIAVTALEKSKVDVALSRFLGAIVRYTVIFATLIAAAGAVGIETTSLTAIFASAGLAVGLALQGSLGNFASGVMILFFRPFTIGDVITCSGSTGKVIEIGLFASELMLLDGTKVIVPNSAVTGGSISNHTTLNKRRSTVAVGVDYGTDLQAAKDALTRAAQAVPQILKDGDDPGFAVVFVNFGDSSLDWVIHAWSTVENFLVVQEALRWNIYKELNAANIGIPFPQVDVHMDKPA